MAGEDEGLHFVATINDDGLVQKAETTKRSIEDITKDVERLGLTVDQFVKGLQGLTQSVGQMTAAVQDAAEAQRGAAKAQQEATERSRKGADKVTESVERTGDALDEAGDSAERMGEQMGSATDKGASGFNKLAKYAAGFFTLQAAQGFARKVFEVRKEVESLQTSFRTLVGDKDKADALFQGIKDFATSTPMQLNDLASAAQTMMGFGLPVEQIMENLKALGDVAMGDTERFKSLSLAFSQASAAGKLTGQDLMQMVNAGFNPLEQISRTTGKSISVLKDEMSKGAISADMLREAFIGATAEGGKFHGMMEEQSKTLKGAYSNLQGAIADMYNQIGEQVDGVMAGAIDAATVLAKNYEKVGAAIVGLVSTFGLYKAALVVATVAESGLSAAEAIHYGWLVATEKAQKLLNATMLSNPYVAVAVALGAVCTALGAYFAGSKKAEQSTDDLNKAFADTQAELAAEQKKIDELFDKLRKAKKGTDDYKSAKDAIINQYGSYLSGLGAEVSSLNDVEGAYRAVAKAAREAAMARGMEAAMRKASEDYGTSYSENYDDLANELREAGVSAKEAGNLMGDLRKDLAETGKVSEQTKKKLASAVSKHTQKDVSETGAEADILARRAVGKYIGRLELNERTYQEVRKQAEEKFGVKDKDTTKPSDQKKWTNQDFEDEIKAKTQELESLSEKEAKGAKGAALKKAIVSLQERKSKAFSTTEGTKQAKAAAREAAKAERQRKAEERKALQQAIIAAEAEEKSTGIQAKQKEERERAARELELATREAQIKAMDEGTEKVIAQIELDYDREMEAIRRGNEEIRQKRIEEAKALWDADPKKKGTDFYKSQAYKDASDVSYTETELKHMEALEELAVNTRAKAREKLAKQEREAMLSYLKEYGDMEQQRIAITQEYEAKIAEARKKGASDYEIASISMERDKQYKELDTKAIEQKIDWSGVFSSLEGHTKEYLEGLRDQLQAILNAGDLPVDQMETIQDKLREINAAISEQGDMFSFIGERARENARLQQEAADARKELASARTEEDTARANLAIAKKTGGKSDIVIAETKLAEAREKTAKATAKAKAAEDAAARTSAQKIADTFADAAEWVNKYLSDLPDLLGKLGLGTLGEKTQQGIDAVNDAAGAAADFASGNYVGAALKAFNAMENIGNIIGVGGLSDKTLEGDIEKLTQSNENLQKAIDALADELSDASVLDIKDIYMQQQKMLEQTEKNYREMMSRSGAAHDSGFWGTGIGGSHSSNKNINDALSASDWAAVSRAAGTSVRGAADFWNLSSKQMFQVMRDANAQWTEIMDKANDGTADAAKFMNEYIELWKKQEEVENAYKERWTSVSFDSVKDSFLSALSDMDKSASDFSQDFTKYLFDAVMNAQVGEMLEKELKGWYEQFSAYMESGAGELTEAEIASLREQWDSIVKQGVSMRDAISEATGYTGSSSEGSATYNAAKSLTQEQGDILNGRLTAIQINTAEGNAIGRQIAASLQSMAAVAGSIAEANTAVLEIRNMMIYTNSHLEDMVRYAKATYNDFGAKLDNMIHQLDTKL